MTIPNQLSRGHVPENESSQHWHNAASAGGMLPLQERIEDPLFQGCIRDGQNTTVIMGHTDLDHIGEQVVQRM